VEEGYHEGCPHLTPQTRWWVELGSLLGCKRLYAQKKPLSRVRISVEVRSQSLSIASTRSVTASVMAIRATEMYRRVMQAGASSPASLLTLWCLHGRPTARQQAALQAVLEHNFAAVAFNGRWQVIHDGASSPTSPDSPLTAWCLQGMQPTVLQHGALHAPLEHSFAAVGFTSAAQTTHMEAPWLLTPCSLQAWLTVLQHLAVQAMFVQRLTAVQLSCPSHTAHVAASGIRPLILWCLHATPTELQQAPVHAWLAHFLAAAGLSCLLQTTQLTQAEVDGPWSSST
jgi:hypothetical protein